MMVYQNKDGSITSNAAPRTIIGQTAIDAEKDATIARLTAELEAARSERDEADRRAGAAERGWDQDRDTLSTFCRVRDQMKEQRGFHRNVSFDKVWADVCAKAARAEAADHAQIAAIVDAPGG